jgi:hypothetical protein
MKLQASRPISPKNPQSQTSAQIKKRLAISRLGILHGRLMNVLWPQKINRGPVATPAGHFFATYAP